MPLISVIIPVYNVEKYLPECIESVLNQTFTEFELILIDDGSTDRSGEICDEYAKTAEGKIRVIHRENGGAGGARNTGIEAATGEYLCFVDSDDYIAPDMLAILESTASENEADLVLFGMKVVDEEGRELRTELDDLPASQLLTLEQNPEILFSLPRVCSKYCKKSLFTKNNLRFPERIWYEDFRVASKLLAAAERIVSVNKTLYYYLQRNGSTMQNANSARNTEIIDAFNDIIDFYRKNGLFERYYSQLEYITVYHLYIAASVRVINIDSNHTLLFKFRTYLREHFPNYKSNPYLSNLDRNKKLIFILLENHMYRSIRMIFQIKGLSRR